MSDWEEYDDNELKELEKRLKKIYRQAYRESQEKVDKYFKSFAEEDEEMRTLYLQGKITKDEYRAWRQRKMLSGKHWTDLRDQVVERIHDANKTAEQIINDETPKTYTRNYNHAQFEGDVNVGVSFELTNENAVKQALKSNHVKFKTVKINDSKDTRYTQERLTNELVSGIVQGKTWREMAKSYQNVLNGSYSQAVRSARTSYTSAQNSGRLDSFERFERAGIKVLKEWMSTKDERTRESHAQLNGVRVAVKEKFPNGLMYPGDPDGSPSEVYNCRCKLVSFFPGSSRDRGLGNTVETYEKWLKQKQGLTANSGNISKGIPELVGHIDDLNDEKAINYLKQEEKELVKNNYETACVVLNNGDIYKVKGDSSSVDIYSIGKSLENSYMYHNHPRNETWCSFSADDVGVFLGDKVKYSKASDYKYEYEMQITEETKNVSFKEAFHEFKSLEHCNEIMQKSMQGEIDYDEDCYNEVMKILSDKYKFNYSRKLKND